MDMDKSAAAAPPKVPLAAWMVTIPARHGIPSFCRMVTIPISRLKFNAGVIGVVTMDARRTSAYWAVVSATVC